MLAHRYLISFFLATHLFALGEGRDAVLKEARSYELTEKGEAIFNDYNGYDFSKKGWKVWH